MAYKAAGALLVAWASANLGALVALALHQPNEAESGWDTLGAAVFGLLWGAIAGVALAIAFAFTRTPASTRMRWAVLGGLLALALLTTWVLELVD